MGLGGGEGFWYFDYPECKKGAGGGTWVTFINMLNGLLLAGRLVDVIE